MYVCHHLMNKFIPILWLLLVVIILTGVLPTCVCVLLAREADTNADAVITG